MAERPPFLGLHHGSGNGKPPQSPPKPPPSPPTDAEVAAILAELQTTQTHITGGPGYVKIESKGPFDIAPTVVYLPSEAYIKTAASILTHPSTRVGTAR